MAASKDDYFKKVGRATATTLSSPGYTIGDSTINTGATTNWPVDTGVTFAIDEVGSDGLRISGTYNVFNGVVSGAGQVSQVEYIGGDPNRDYSAGATTRVYILVSAYRDNQFTDGILVHANQNGTLKDTAIPANSIDNSNIKTGAAIDGSKLADSSVTNAKLKTGAGEPGGEWDTWTPTLSGRFNDSKWTKNCKYKRVGNTIFCKFYVTANTTTPMDGSGNPIFTLPVTSVSGYPTSGVIARAYIEDVGTAGYSGGLVRWQSTTTADFAIENVGSTYGAPNSISNTVPFTWASTDIIFATFTYEAAP